MTCVMNLRDTIAATELRSRNSFVESCRLRCSGERLDSEQVRKKNHGCLAQKPPPWVYLKSALHPEGDRKSSESVTSNFHSLERRHYTG